MYLKRNQRQTAVVVLFPVFLVGSLLENQGKEGEGKLEKEVEE